MAVSFSAGGDGGTRRQPSDPVRGISPPELYGIDGERRKRRSAQGSGLPFTRRRRRRLRRKGRGPVSPGVWGIFHGSAVPVNVGLMWFWPHC